MRRFQPRWVEGRRIVQVHMNPRRASDGSAMHDPEIELDNGAMLRFMTEEDPDGAEYGIRVVYTPPRRRR